MSLFAPRPAAWQTHRRGRGALIRTSEGLRFFNGPTSDHRYTNAQIDDYQQLSRQDFLWCPPASLSLRARFSHDASRLRGTAGFGFWNDPFMMTGARWPTLPRALWFFYSAPPSSMALAQSVPGWGWKAATIDALRWPFALMAPTAPLAMLLMRWQTAYRRLWPIAQRAMHVCEAMVNVDMTDWHEYRIEWARESVRFVVDGRTVLKCETAPAGPLGFVCWLDNQYMVVTPQGRVRHGLVASERGQWMDVADLVIN